MISGAIPAAICLAAAAVAGPLPEKQVTAVRFWPLADVTRVAIELTGEFQYRSERLFHPDRVFFDFPDTLPRIDGRRFTTVEAGDRLIQRIRVAETQPGITRVVFDLAGPADFTVSQLVNPHRLILEFRASAPGPAPAIVTQGPAIAAVQAGQAPPAPSASPQPDPPKAARRQSDGGSSLIRALGLKTTRIVIDAGHGGHDYGTIGPGGFSEKELVLDLAMRLGRLVEERLGLQVAYTRTDDVFVPLQARTALANEQKADLFVSLHANSSRSSRIAGVETYYLNFTSSRESLDVAARENASSEKSVHDLRDLITKITRSEKMEESKDLAERVQASLHSFCARYHRGVRDRGVKSAPFVVLIGAEMPSVLAEVAFLSNPREEALLRRPDHRQKLAEALFKGISRWVESLSSVHVAAAE
jgi:N-acetylmuramoyl-L-alanine amidase